MSKIIKSLIFLVFFGTSVFSKSAHSAFGMGTDNPMLKICEYANSVASIINAYPNLLPSLTPIPYVPFVIPGMLVGMSQRTSVLLEMCNLLQDIVALDTQGAIYAIGRMTNTLTDNKWSHHLNMADSTWNLANQLYDFNEGKQRKGSLTSAMAHRDINDFMKTSYGWYNKTFNDSDAQLKNRGERETDMNQYASLVQKRAILAEALACPDASTNPNYQTIYKTQIAPQERKRVDAQDNIIFFKGKLLQMGPRFMNTQEDLELYVKELENLERNGVTYKISNQIISETTSKPGTRTDKEGKPIMSDVKVKRNIQQWDAQLFADVFEKFKTKWSPKWSDYVNARWVGQSRGFLTSLFDKGSRRSPVEEEFQDLNFECNPSRLMLGFDMSRQDYEKVRDQKYNDCMTKTKLNQKTAENLLTYYVGQLQVQLKVLKDANAIIWTKESEILGVNRSVQSKPNSDGYQQETISCSKGNKLSEAELKKLELQQQSLNTELKGMTAKQHHKKATLMEMKAQADKESSEERNKRNAFAESKQKQSSELLKSQVAPVAIEGGI